MGEHTSFWLKSRICCSWLVTGTSLDELIRQRVGEAAKAGQRQTTIRWRMILTMIHQIFLHCSIFLCSLKGSRKLQSLAWRQVVLLPCRVLKISEIPTIILEIDAVLTPSVSYIMNNETQDWRAPLMLCNAALWKMLNKSYSMQRYCNITSLRVDVSGWFVLKLLVGFILAS